MSATEFADVTILSDKDLRGFERDDIPFGPIRAMVPEDSGFSSQWYLDNPEYAALGGVDIDIAIEFKMKSIPPINIDTHV